MPRVLDEITATTGVRLYPVRGVCVDSDDPGVPQDAKVDATKIKPGMLAEIDPGPFPINVALHEGDPTRGYDRKRSLFEYFLDGTRRTFLVAELATSSQRYLPVLAGQISAAVVKRERDTGRVHVARHDAANVVALPGGGIGINQGDLDELQERLRKWSRPFQLVVYGEKGVPDSKQPTDLAIAKINQAMQSLEIGALEVLTNRNLTSASSMLVVDGSVQFTRIPLANRSWLRNVVGVSKTFRTNLIFTKDKREIGAILVDTIRNVGDRTPAFRYEFRGNAYAVWYLRIRDRTHTDKPLSGIVKLERLLLTGDELEYGLATDIVNNISLSIVGERYVTPFGRDERWTNHLYPVYLAERYQRGLLMSEAQFLRLL